MDRRTCSVEGCERNTVGRGLCNAHYLRERLHGDPNHGGTVVKNTRAIDHPDGTRTCSKCRQRKPLDEFDRDKGARLGRRSQCKPCRGALVQDWYRANHERQLGRARDRYERDLDKIRANDLKRYQRHRAKRISLATEIMHIRRAAIRTGIHVRGITWVSLRKRDGDACCYCGVTMSFERSAGRKYNPLRATIEHLVPISAGGAHDWDNVALCCHQCNLQKNRTPLEEWMTKLATRLSTAADASSARAEFRPPTIHPTLW